MAAKQYNFDNKINRKNTNSVKWDLLKLKFRTEDVLRSRAFATRANYIP
jgi:bifunctional pyridoxal-dependent enzyme with beta-cystathionase and maltose regulon repressor activities